jgi:MFS superfamily sulfate permease-like transporter
MRLLAEHGSSVQIMELRGFIFFGSAHQLRESVKTLVVEQRPLMLIFDFSRVVGGGLFRGNGNAGYFALTPR